MQSIKRIFVKNIIIAFLICTNFIFAQQESSFEWPEGKKMAISLSWDDARNSQVIVGTPLLDEYNIKATFYVVPAKVEEELNGWKLAVKNGHEIANHSLNHPCSGNFLWARKTALEDYSLKQMASELIEANIKLKTLLGVTPTEFAYPCGQTFVGRGLNTKSYVPVISEQFTSGRTWLDEEPNDPSFCDLAQLTGIEMDGKSYEQIIEQIEKAKNNGLWLILGGHEMGSKNFQTTEIEMLKKLLPYLKDSANEIWVAPVGEIAAYVKSKRTF